ncbi:MAG: nuclear transport factor 2 family protein [Flavobacterium sp.]|nr:MAG: nuclear transport factor 2 family protein [Flavobacterium sp.]
MKNGILFCLFICIAIQHPLFGQENQDAESQVNTQVWQAFKTAYEARDSEAFKAIHTDDVLRVNDGGIKTAPEYFASIDSWRKSDDTSITIDFAFENRQYNAHTGYETGYYRVVYTRENGESLSYYGQFHVILRLVDGKWMIAQDFDTSTIAGRKVDGSFFDGATFLELN